MKEISGVSLSRHLITGDRVASEDWTAGCLPADQDTMTYYEGLKSTISLGHGQGKGTGKS